MHHVAALMKDALGFELTRILAADGKEDSAHKGSFTTAFWMGYKVSVSTGYFERLHLERRTCLHVLFPQFPLRV